MRFHSQMKLLSFFLLALLVSTTAAAAADRGKYIFYVGTYTDDGGTPTKSKGIYAYRYDASTGHVAPLGLAAETVNPSFLAVHPSGRFLYAVNEVGNYKGPNSGGVSAFSIDRATGKLTLLNQVASRGADPCYITVDKTGKYVLVANYTGGSVAVFPVHDDGSLGEASSFVQHTGHGSDPQRQEGPHAHSIKLSADDRFAYANDLGLDEVLVYKFDASKGTLTPSDPPFATLSAGSGPRHFALAPNGEFGYVISEILATVTAFHVNRDTGSLQSLQTVKADPPDYHGPNEAAEIEVHPSGKFLYASNRGDDDSIHMYAIAAGKGTLTPIGQASTKGKTPRSFEIDPTGRFLFAENQKSDNIVIFKIDEKTGQLSATGNVVDVVSPVCVKFVKVD
jgi:6-phosphogluconolactonase